MQLRFQFQQNPVAGEVSALTAVVRPILEGTLYALKRDIVQTFGGYDRVTLAILARIYRPGDGDCGLCFEYAVHDAMNRGDATVVERLSDAQARCGVRGADPASILFGVEKSGSLDLIDTVHDSLTDDSRLMAGTRGQPVKLKRHIDAIAAAFRKREMREKLPWSISGLWKADLFIGDRDSDRWVATSVKINRTGLEKARGLRIGIVPAREGRGDAIYRDLQRNLIVCPLPHDGAFMEVFYQGWGIVRQFIAADAHVPNEIALPRPAERQVARYLADRRTFPVLDVIEVLRPLAQPELLRSNEREAQLYQRRTGENEIQAVVAPVARNTQRD